MSRTYGNGSLEVAGREGVSSAFGGMEREEGRRESSASAVGVEVPARKRERAAAESGSTILYHVVKRAFDLAVSFVGCLILIPLALAVKTSYVLTGDHAPIMLRQKRIGKDGREFVFYKFRTMVLGKDGEMEAENLLSDLYREHPEYIEQMEKYGKIEDDPRVTKAGRFFRRTSLDEFPQFLNVLLGDLSIVGNRPYLPREREQMGEYFADIVRTKGGVISYWAVSGRNALSFQERLELESYYSNHQSLALDLKIFLAAFRVVLSRGGAF